jgi:hypothetical protein
LEGPVYHFVCVCGESVSTRVVEGTCPHCGRGFELRWQAPYEPTPEGKAWPELDKPTLSS